MKTLTLILILFQIRNLLACWGPPPVWHHEDHTAPHSGGSNNSHWIPTPGLTMADYNKWMDEYRKLYLQRLQDQYKAGNNTWPDRPADAGSDWPAYWKGLGPGYSGEKPPPWAYIEKSSGKADLCFMNPKKGPCTQRIIRWGFNPYVDDCKEFEYGGCQGNANNFLNYKRCREACIGVPVGNCVSGSDLQMNYYDFPEIPKE